MRVAEQEKAGHWGGTAFCVLVLLACFAIIHPVLEAGYSDDFSYIFTAKRAAETGRMIYNGWACPMLGFQVYLAALLIKLFGFSFTVVRSSVMLIAVANVALLHRMFLRLLPRNGNAIAAALCLAAGPAMLMHSTVFFTDVPGQFAFNAALFCSIAAMGAEDDAGTRRCLLWCVVLNLLLGTVRQTAWLGSLVLLPMVGWRLRHRGGVLRLTVVLWLVSLACVGAGVVWLSHAPYSPQESLKTHLSRGWLLLLPLLPALLLIEVLPLLVGVAGIREAVRNRRLMAASAAVTAGFFGLWWMTRMTLATSLVLGVIHIVPRYAVAMGLAALTVLTFLLTMVVGESAHALQSKDNRVDGVCFRDLLLVLWPYLLVTAALVMTREGVWARYVLPLTPAVGVLLYRLHAERTHGARLPAVSFVLVACSMAVGVVVMHDDLRWELPILRLEQVYRAMGLPRAQLEAGMVEDGWYELSTGHTINEPRIRFPKDAYHPRPMTSEQRRCHTYFLPMAPDIHPSFVIDTAPSPCYEKEPMAEEAEHFWMRPTVVESLYRYIPSQRMP